MRKRPTKTETAHEKDSKIYDYENEAGKIRTRLRVSRSSTKSTKNEKKIADRGQNEPT